MPNTFSPFSVEQDSNPFEELPDLPQARPEVNGFEQFLDQSAEQDMGRVSAAARWAKQYDPETYARATKIAPGVPPEVGARQIKTLEEQARLRQYQEVFAKAPALRSHFASNPKDLPYANPDELDQLTGINWAIRAFPEALESGVEQTQLGLLGWEDIAGRLSPDEHTKALLESNQPSRTFGAHGDWTASGLVWLGQSLPTIASVGLAALNKGAQYAIAGGLSGAAIGAVTGPGAVASGAAGMAAGGRVGLAVGGFEQNVRIQAGLAYYDFLKFRDENGQPLDPLVAKWAALLAGVGQGGLEQLGLAKTVGKIPGLGPIFDNLSTKGMKQALRNPGVRTALTNFAKNLGESVSVETLTEMGQQGIQVLSGELAKQASGQDFQMLSAEDIAQQVMQAGVQALQVMTILGPVISGTRFAADIHSMNRTRRAAKNLERAEEQVAENPFVQRAPDAAARVIDAQAGNQKLYIPAEEMKELYQSEGLDIYGPPLPNWRDRVDGALATGGDIEVTLGEYLAHLAGDPKNNPLRDLVRVDPGDYTPAEIKPYIADLDSMLSSEVARASDEAAVSQRDEQVFDVLKNSAVNDLGFTPQAADHYALLLESHLRTRAEQLTKNGLPTTPMDLLQKFGPVLQRSDEEGMSTPVHNVNEPSQVPDELFQPAWHGTPHEFEQFDSSKIGTGEGAQAFGYGLYFAGDRSLAEFYRNKLTRSDTSVTYDFDGEKKSLPLGLVAGDLATYGLELVGPQETYPFIHAIDNIRRGKDLNTAIKEMYADYPHFDQSKVKMAENVLRKINPRIENKKGRIFQVDLPEDEALAVWDDQLQNQSETVRRAFQEALEERGALESLRRVYGEAGIKEIPVSALYRTLEESFEGWKPDNGWTISTGPATRGDKAASALLLSKGIAGHKFLKGGSRGKGLKIFKASWDEGFGHWKTESFPTEQEAREFLEEVQGFDMSQDNQFARIEEITPQIEDFNFVIYDDAHVKVLQYFQEQRGSITFRKDGPALIKLFSKADMSTLLHEAGHFFLQTTRDLAETSPEIAADWEIIKKHLKIGDDNKITREQHEQFARWAEAYFMEGKSPSPELRSAFQAFRQWLKAIYKSLKKLGGSVHPDIQQVFDRMLVTDERLKALANDTAYAPLFRSAEEMGLDPADYLEYQNLVEDLKNQASDGLIGRVVGQQKKLLSGWRKEIEGQLRKEAKEKLQNLPPFSHIQSFKQSGFGIDREAFEKKYGKEATKKFPAQAFSKNGLDPQVAAELLGYPTADEMVFDFVQAPSLKEAAEAEARAEMVRRYGDNFEEQEILDLAVKRALAEDGRVTVLAKEYKALSAKAGREVSEKGPKQIAKEVARRSLYSKRVRDVNERRTQAAARRAGTMSEQAMLRGDWNVAADWKRKQILAQAIDNETQTLNRTLEKIRDKAAKYARTAPKGIDPATMEQIRALVTQYEFAKVPLRKLDRRESLAEFLNKAEAEGFVVAVPDYLRKQAAVTNYKNLLVEDLLGFGDALDNLEHIGKLKHKLRLQNKLRAWRELKGEMLGQLELLPKKPQKNVPLGKFETDLRTKLDAVASTLLKAETIFSFLDMGDIKGAFQQNLMVPISEAQAAQNELNLEYNARIMEIFDKIEPNYLSEIVNVPGIGQNMTREAIYSVALNWGNYVNRAKLMEGMRWTEGQVAEILSHLKKEDWQRINSVWKLLDRLWPRISALEKKLTGVAPPRVEGTEINNIHGVWDGGYYPLVYDYTTPIGKNLEEDQRPEDKKNAPVIWDNKFIRPGTSHSHTYKRTKVAKPIRLSLSVLPGHIHSVIHDLTHREAIQGAVKILWDPDIRQGIIERESEAKYDQLTHWLKNIATERPLDEDANLRWLSHIRIGATIYGLGFRFTTVASQILGFGPSMGYGIKHRYMAQSLIAMSKHPRATWDFANQASAEIRDRFNQQDRDIRQTVRILSKSSRRLDRLKVLAFYPIAALDKFVSIATWTAQYNQQLELDPADHKTAVQKADQAVRLTQGTGFAKDMAKVMSSGEFNRFMTMFYTAMSATYNQIVVLTRKSKRDLVAGDVSTFVTEDLPRWLYLVVAPAILGAYITGQGPDDDESEAAWMARKVLMYPLSATAYVRDVVNLVDTGFGFKPSPGFRALESTSRALNALFSPRSDDELEERLLKAAKPAAEVAAILLHLPAGQPISTGEAIWKGFANGDFELKDLALGRRDKDQ